ncbi:RNA-guided endonuclease InsQ/TnpB family protein [Nocardiopsis valliformis]|uniref:RNA-guided endonuclease InsQ/TnpB family protein n=1 Tax=Nocardiopsis valliformis TaxID=239974 RepID=UPI000348BB4C|nr:RNA-guided endonuclease TnpB family protein [Nocardiopsis valliformis]
MLSGRRYRLELTGVQAQSCAEFGDVCRAVWNTALDQRRQYVDRYTRGRGGEFCGYHLQAGQLAEAKAEEEWLKAAPSHILQQTLKDLDRACREHGTFQVKFRAKGRWSPSFRFPDAKQIRVEKLNRKWGRVKLPKLGWCTLSMSRPLGGQVRSATVSHKSGRWFVSFLVEDGQLAPEHHPGTPVGVDRGVVVAATTSDGQFHDREFATEGEKTRYRCLQQRLARQRKGSANRRKTLAAMNRIMGRVTDRRGDFCAWTANRLTCKHSVVVLEDLNTRGMTASARGTVEDPGKRVRQKAGLNKAILGKGWNRLEAALNNAARYTGTTIVKVNPAFTSQTCHECDHTDSASRESQARFRCTKCQHECHADVNAAKNVCRAAGHAVPACGDLGVTRSEKQEPVGIREVVPHQPALPLVGIPRL